jgi:hypothetical protein
MNMEMVDSLAGVPTAVDHRSESIFPQILAFRYPGCRKQELSKYVLVAVKHRLYMLFRNHQEMNRRLRINIFNCYAIIVLVQNPGAPFTAGDITEYTIAHRSPR